MFNLFKRRPKGWVVCATAKFGTYVLNFHPASGWAWGGLGKFAMTFSERGQALAQLSKAPLLVGATLSVRRVDSLPRAIREALGLEAAAR